MRSKFVTNRLRLSKIALLNVHQIAAAGIAPEDEGGERQYAQRNPECDPRLMPVVLIASASSAP